MKKKSEFEILIENQYHLIGHIYKLLLRYKTETVQTKTIIRWMQNFKETVTIQQW